MSHQRLDNLRVDGVVRKKAQQTRDHTVPPVRRSGPYPDGSETWTEWRARLRGRLRLGLEWKAWLEAHPGTSKQDAMATLGVEWGEFYRNLSFTRLPAEAQRLLLDESLDGAYPGENTLHRIARMKDPNEQMALFDKMLKRHETAWAAMQAQPPEEGRGFTGWYRARETLERAMLWEGWLARGECLSLRAIGRRAGVSESTPHRYIGILRGLAPEVRDTVLGLEYGDRRLPTLHLFELSRITDPQEQIRAFDQRHPGLRDEVKRKRAA